MRVLHVITGLNLGGAEVMLQRLVKASRGAEHQVVSLLDLGVVAARIQALGVRTRALGMSRVPNPAPVVRLASMIREARPDVVQTWMYHADLVGGLAARLARGPKVVWGIHNSTLDRSNRMTRAIVAASARLSRRVPDRIVCVSRRARDLHVGLGYDAGRFTVVPNGVDTTEYRRVPSWRREVREELGIPDAAVLVGLVARVHPQKDHATFIAAAGALSRRRRDVRFLLCGDGTADDPGIGAALDREGVRDRFHLLGPRADVPRVMNALDVLSLSSAFGEALPLVVAEAMACEVPCAVTDLGDCALLVGDAGRVAPPRDPEGLARAWEALVDLGEDGRRRLGWVARRRIEAEYGLPAVAEQYEAVYRDVLARAPLRVVHVATVPQTLWFLEGHLSDLAARGVDVTAVSSPGDELDRLADSERVGRAAVPMAREIAPLADLVSLVRLVRTFRALRPDVVDAHTPKAGLLGMIAARLAGVPVRVYHLHGLRYLTATGLRRWILRLTERVASTLASRVLCVSRSVARVAADEGLVPAGRMAVLLAGSIGGVDATGRFAAPRDDAERRAARVALGLPPEALVLGFVGRLVRDKGVVELVEAWRRLREEHPELRLLVVGEREPGDPIPDAIAAALRDDPRVRLAGYDRDTPRYYRAMDVLALPSYREGFPVVPLEAAAMGLPVVATRVPGCVDAVVDGVTGTLVPPGDAGALAAALRAYLSEGALRARHGAAGRERALRDYDPRRVWEALHAELVRLARSGAPRPGLAAAGRTTTVQEG